MSLPPESKILHRLGVKFKISIWLKLFKSCTNIKIIFNMRSCFKKHLNNKLLGPQDYW